MLICWDFLPVLLVGLLTFVFLLHPSMTATSYHLPHFPVIRFALLPFWPKTPPLEATRRAAGTLPIVCQGGTLLHPAVAWQALLRVTCRLGKDEEEDEEEDEEAELEEDLEEVVEADGTTGDLKPPVPRSRPRTELAGGLTKPPRG